MKYVVLGVLAAAIAVPAVAADEQHYAKPPKPHLICKRDESTGTRMSKPVCKTAAQWADSADEGEARLDGINRQATTGDTGGTLTRERPR